jgi:hypothetical protein
MKARYWSLAIVLFLINYLIFATLFTMLAETDFGATQATRTPVPTFTPAPVEPIIVVPTPVPVLPEPTATATHVIQGAESNAGSVPSTHEGIIQAKSVQATYQFEPAEWSEEPDMGQTRFFGEIKDVAGQPVNGVSVQARCGDYAIISSPSGPAAGEDQISAGWPPGFYDLTIDTRPIPCVWVLTVIAAGDGQTVTELLSEAIPVQTTAEKAVIMANWRKNW